MGKRVRRTVQDNITVKQLNKLDAGEEAKANILGNNAARLFGP